MAIYPFPKCTDLRMYRFHIKVIHAGKPAFNLLTSSTRGTAGYIQQAIPHPFGYTNGLFSFVFFRHHSVTTALINAVVTLSKRARAEQGIDMVSRSL